MPGAASLGAAGTPHGPHRGGENGQEPPATPGASAGGVSRRPVGSEGKGDVSSTNTGLPSGRVLPTPSSLLRSFATKKDEADSVADVGTCSAASDPEPGGPRALGP